MTAPDPRMTYDAWRDEPVALDDQGRPVLCRHADVVAAALDPDTYSSSVSRFLQVPNGLNGDAHREARRLLDPFFARDRMVALEPVVQQIASDLVAELPTDRPIDAVTELGSVFAVRAQSAWLGWPAELERELLDWIEENHQATRSGDLSRTADVAARFNAIIRGLLDVRRSEDAPDDVTTELVRLRDRDGDPLGDEVLISVLRNWTGGDLGSLALCTGVIASYLASRPGLQQELSAGDDDTLVAAIDEVLRIDDPFVSNRRKTTRKVELGGQLVAAGMPVVLNWTAANRDPAVFAEPDRFDPDTNAAANLVYGIGPHVCPGRPLATLELRVLTRALLQQVRWEPAVEPPEREQPPLGGFRRVPIVLHR